MDFRDDTRGVSALVGALFLLFFVVLALSGYQTAIVPNQNADIEAQHYTDVQGDLASVRSALINAGESGTKRSAVVSLGTTYPSRIVAMNAAPPAGSFSTTVVGNGTYESDTVDMRGVCGLGWQNSVGTRALDYSPGYNYFDGGNFDHRIESTLFYQVTEDDPLTRVNQTIVEGRTVTLYPVQGEMSERGIIGTSVEFVGNETGGARVSPDFNVTIPTRAGVGTWDERVSHPDVSVSDAGPNEVNLTFEGSDDWTVLCKPVGVNQDLEEQVHPSTPPSAGAGTDPNDGAGTGAGAGAYSDFHEDSTEVFQDGAEGGIWDNITTLNHVYLSELNIKEDDPFEDETKTLTLEFDIRNKSNSDVYDVEVKLQYDWEADEWSTNEVTIEDPEGDAIVDEASFDPATVDSIFLKVDGSGRLDLVGNADYQGDPWGSTEKSDFEDFAGSDTYIEIVEVADGSVKVEIED